MNNRYELDDSGIVSRCPHCDRRNRMAYERLGQTFRCGSCHTELAAPNEPLNVDSETAFAALVGGSPLPVLVDFWAEWCGPCKMVAPEVAKVAGEGQGQWVVAKVNTESAPALAQRFHISSIPTFVLFRSGHELARQSGAMPAAALRQFVQQNQFAGIARESFR